MLLCFLFAKHEFVDMKEQKKKKNYHIMFSTHIIIDFLLFCRRKDIYDCRNQIKQK